MRRTIIILLVNFALADALAEDRWINGMSVSTNVDGVVLTLEFADVSVIAGERLQGRMVVSNASNEPRQMSVDRGMHNTHLDTDIGQFVVMDDEGNQLSRTFWRRPPQGGSSMIPSLKPGGSMAFEGDLVKKYSLTNPGIYLVKAVARVGRPGVVVMAVIDPARGPRPVIEPIDGAEEMIIETPFVAVTVVRRPEGMPAPAPLHTADEIANTVQGRDPPQLQVTHPKPEAVPRAPRVRDRNAEAESAPANVDPVGAVALATPEPPKRLLYYGVPMFVGGLGLFIIGVIFWRSRRRGA